MRQYTGAYEFFDFSAVRTHPIADRRNKVTLRDLVHLDALTPPLAATRDAALVAVADAVRSARNAARPVIWFMGAHPVKLGLSPIVIDLMERGLLTHVAGTCATAIHDFELALIGETSENVPNALPQGTFGMARETGHHMNAALAEGWRRGLGFGESLGRLILGEPMPDKVTFRHPERSVLAAGIRLGIPVTIHAGIGTDIIDQHPDFDGAAKGGTSGFDFGIFAASVATLGGRELRGHHSDGVPVIPGVVLNIGSAVTGPEVLLKAVSMAANVGRPPTGLVCATFDLRPVAPGEVLDDAKPGYYFRDSKSVATRIPEAFGGRGYYVRGNFKDTLPALYKLLTP